MLTEHGKIYTENLQNIQGRRKQMLCKICILKRFLKKLYKTIDESISSNVVDLFKSKSTRREIAHSKGTPSIRAFEGHLDTQDTWALKALAHSMYFI